MNPLGGLLKLGIAGVLAWSWANGYLSRALDKTTEAFRTPRALKVPTFPTASEAGGSRTRVQ